MPTIRQEMPVLRGAAIFVAVWSCLYCFIQIGIMGWQTKVVRDMKWELDNRQIPIVSGLDPFQARFPGLYARYTETPERRRINALFVIAIVNLILAIGHLVLSALLVYGCIQRKPNSIWPWFLTVVASIIMSATYAVIWWSGDVFNEELTATYAEFLMAMPVNSIGLGIILFYYLRLLGIDVCNKEGKKKSYPGAIAKQPLVKYSSAHQRPYAEQQRPNWPMGNRPPPPAHPSPQRSRRNEFHSRPPPLGYYQQQQQHQPPRPPPPSRWPPALSPAVRSQSVPAVHQRPRPAPYSSAVCSSPPSAPRRPPPPVQLASARRPQQSGRHSQF